jgi:endonuclease YncB( thermonuclease family)
MKALSVTTYAALRNKVRETLLLGQRKIDQARIQTYWTTGHYINQHVRVNGGRAEYGKKVILKLSEDLNVGDDLLYRCSQFNEKIPISANWRKLSWSHLRALCRVPGDTKRLALLEQAAKHKWPSPILEKKIRDLRWDARTKLLESKPSLLPVPALGPFYTYQVIAPETVHSTSKQLLLDLGFSCRLEMDIFLPKKFPAGAVVTSAKDVKGLYSLKTAWPQNKTPHSVLNAQDSLLYTYKAFIQRFIDADTFHVEFKLGFGQLREETIRLRGIDCPEINTPEGRRAKQFVEDALSACEFITVKSTQTRKEKWGRYLGDVFYTDKTGKQACLNNLLLEKGHAVRVRS